MVIPKQFSKDNDGMAKGAFTCFCVCNLQLASCLLVLPFHFKIMHRAATTNKNKIRTYTSRGNKGSQTIKQFNRLIHRLWVTRLLGTVIQVCTLLLR